MGLAPCTTSCAVCRQRGCEACDRCPAQLIRVNLSGLPGGSSARCHHHPLVWHDHLPPRATPLGRTQMCQRGPSPCSRLGGGCSRQSFSMMCESGVVEGDSWGASNPKMGVSTTLHPSPPASSAHHAWHAPAQARANAHSVDAQGWMWGAHGGFMCPPHTQLGPPSSAHGSPTSHDHGSSRAWAGVHLAMPLCTLGPHLAPPRCCIHRDLQDKGMTVSMFWQVPLEPGDAREAWMVMGSEAFRLGGGLTLAFDGASLPHGVWVRDPKAAEGSAPWFGCAAVAR